jgi:hypothetical protein
MMLPAVVQFVHEAFFEQPGGRAAMLSAIADAYAALGNECEASALRSEAQQLGGVANDGDEPQSTADD